MKFTVKWEVHYYDQDIKLYCDIDQDEDHVKTLYDIFKFLDEGLEEPDTFTPEMEVEFHDGDFNIEIATSIIIITFSFLTSISSYSLSMGKLT